VVYHGYLLHIHTYLFPPLVAALLHARAKEVLAGRNSDAFYMLGLISRFMDFDNVVDMYNPLAFEEQFAILLQLLLYVERRRPMLDVAPIATTFTLRTLLDRRRYVDVVSLLIAPVPDQQMSIAVDLPFMLPAGETTIKLGVDFDTVRLVGGKIELGGVLLLDDQIYFPINRNNPGFDAVLVLRLVDRKQLFVFIEVKYSAADSTTVLHAGNVNAKLANAKKTALFQMVQQNSDRFAFCFLLAAHRNTGPQLAIANLPTDLQDHCAIIGRELMERLLTPSLNTRPEFMPD
jgi:hypothetical protein